jgi:deoxycytidine triphosphate deaminase
LVVSRPEAVLDSAAVKPDAWIARMALEHGMIEPFEPKLVREGRISYGLSSHGYDMRLADEFLIFTNVWGAVVDPKAIDEKVFVKHRGDFCLIPPNSFALGRSEEYFRMPRGITGVCLGKCLTGDARIVNPRTGARLRLDQFVRERHSHVVAHHDGRLASVRVEESWDRGLQTVYRVTTCTGRSIEATAEHPFLKFEGWTPLKQLRRGDRIGVARQLDFFGSEEVPDAEADLLGLMLADGQCRTPGSSPRYTTGDGALARLCVRSARKMGWVARPVGTLGLNITNRGRRGGVMSPNGCGRWLASMGVNVLSKRKFVPDRIFTAQRRAVQRFLRALYSGDGGITIGRASIHLEYSSASERLARDVQHLLLRFGIVTSLRRRRTNYGTRAFVLTSTDKEMIRRFARDIGFVPGCAKQVRLKVALGKILRDPKRKSDYDTLPPAAWEPLRHAARRAGSSLFRLGIHQTVGQSLPVGVAQRVLEVAPCPQVQSSVGSDILWDTIVSVRRVGLKRTYDLSVPGFENFVANDFVVHNSTYARCGIVCNVTPLEAGWEGHVTIEISNTTPLPAKVYAHEGICQVLFFEGDEPCATSYADRQGKYQAQRGITLPKV